MNFCLETDRLILRNILAEDEERYFLLDSDPQVQQYVGNQPIKTIEEARTTINFIRQQYLTNGIGRCAVIEKESGLFIGWCGLKLITSEFNGVKNFYELGYRFIPEYWGQGYATESAKAWLDFGFEKLNLSTIYAYTAVGNTASNHVLQKLGFQLVENFMHEGLLHHWLKINKISVKI